MEHYASLTCGWCSSTELGFCLSGLIAHPYPLDASTSCILSLPNHTKRRRWRFSPSRRCLRRPSSISIAAVAPCLIPVPTRPWWRPFTDRRRGVSGAWCGAHSLSAAGGGRGRGRSGGASSVGAALLPPYQPRPWQLVVPKRRPYRVRPYVLPPAGGRACPMRAALLCSHAFSQ